MANQWQSGFLRDDTTGALVVSGGAGGSAAKPAAGLFLGGNPAASNVTSIGNTAISDGVATEATARSKHIVSAAAGPFRVLYGNVRILNYYEGDVGGPNDIDINVGFERPDGTVDPVFFGGRSVCTVSPGALVLSDPIGYGSKLGDAIYFRTHVKVASGAFWISNSITAASRGEGVGAGVDKSLSGTITASNSNGLTPLAIVADADLPSVGLLGDSIFNGTGDLGVEPNWGFGRRALNEQFGYVCCARSSDQISYVATPGFSRVRFQMLAGCKYVVVQHAVNDVLNSRTAGQIEADWLTVATQLAAAGSNVYQTTTTPGNTSSTDSYATLGNQTADARSLDARVTANDWLRDGAPIDATTKAAVAVGTSSNVLRTAYISWNGSQSVVTGSRDVGHPLAGALEVADLVESARNSSKWKVDGTANKYTSDGTHPSAFAHAVLAHGIPTSLFV